VQDDQVGKDGAVDLSELRLRLEQVALRIEDIREAAQTPRVMLVA